MYVHGYEDANVKIAVADEFFNRLEVPKLGIFGHWDHIWPPRPEAEVLFLAWIDQYLQGRNIGLSRLPNALVENNLGQHARLRAVADSEGQDRSTLRRLRKGRPGRLGEEG